MPLFDVSDVDFTGFVADNGSGVRTCSLNATKSPNSGHGVRYGRIEWLVIL